MINSLVKFGVVAVLATLLSACAGSKVYHENLMAGQIVRTDGNQVVLCIGSAGGAEKDMTFDVFSVKYDETGSDSEGYFREFAGTVSVTEVIDGHFARATVKSGNVQVNDMVELKD